MKIKLLIATLASLYFLYCASDVTQWHFIDNVNLLVHEGGHIVFGLFGQFMGILGGSLMQVLLPSLFVVYFVYRDEMYSAALVLFWVGENLLNVSNYAADALKMQLPLLFGDDSIHDWNWLLFETHQLRHTNAIATTIRLLGILAIIIAAGWSIYEATKKQI